MPGVSDDYWEDANLVRSVLRGEQPAFARIVEKYWDSVYSVCYGHVLNHEEALDLVQDVFIRAYERLDTLRNWRRLGPFLSVIARNQSINRYNSRRLFQSAKEELERLNVDEKQMQHDLSEAERNDLHAVLRVLIKTLPAHSREVVLLHYFQEMSTAEIASFLDIKQAAVLKRLHYGRKLLRTRMERELRPALQDDQQRSRHIHGILAAIPFGSAPWAGKPLLVQPKPWPLSRPVGLLKSGAVGAGLAAVTGLAMLWFFLMYPQQPNPSEPTMLQEQPVATAPRYSPAPDVSFDSTIPKKSSGSTIDQSLGAAPAAPEPIHLVLGSPPWSPPQESREALGALIQAYSELEPGVTISLAPDREAPAEAGLTREDVGDIILDESIRGGGNYTLAVLRAVDAVVPLDEFIAESAFDMADYYPNLRDSVTVDGRVWGVPFLVDSWAFSYPSNIEAEPWIAERLRHWDDFPELLDAMWVDSLDDSGDISAASLDPGILWTCLFLDVGGDLNDVKTMAPGSTATAHAFEQFWNWYEANPPAFRPLGAGADERLDDGLVMVTGLSAHRRSLQAALEEHTDAQVVSAPGPGAISAVFTHVLAITRSTPEKERAAWRFVQWLCSRDVMTRLHDELGVLPLRASVADLVTTPEEIVMLEQLRRMRFQKPVVECITAYEELQSALDRELSSRHEAHKRSEISTGILTVVGATTMASGKMDGQP